MGGEKQSLRGMKRESAIIVKTATPRKDFIQIQSEGFCKYINVLYVIINDCIIVKINFHRDENPTIAIL